MALQLATVFSIMVVMQHFRLLDRLQLSNKFHHNLRSQVVFYIVGLFNIVSALVLLCMKDRCPLNYLMLATTTLLSGVFWGLAPTMVTPTLHFQLIGILCCTMIVATVMSTILVSLKPLKPVVVLIVSLVTGWFVGVIIDVFVIANFFEVSSFAVLGVIGFSFLLLAVLHLEAGRALIQCRPDDFMTVIVGMNSTLMVVVSIPFFIVSFCFLHTGEAVMEEDQNEPQAAPDAVGLGRPDGAAVVLPV